MSEDVLWWGSLTFSHGPDCLRRLYYESIVAAKDVQMMGVYGTTALRHRLRSLLDNFVNFHIILLNDQEA